MGSPQYRTMAATGCTITEAWFLPNAYLPPHTHDRPIFGVMLSGAFKSAIANRTLECPPAAVWVEPLGERHANRIGRDGARVIVVQPEASLVEGGAFSSYLGAVQHLRHPGIAGDALRVARELEDADDLSMLVVDGLVQTMLAVAVRRDERRRFHAATPRWLLLAQEITHAQFRERVGLSQVAAAVGMSASHLAREFRAHFGTTLGEYVRQLRVEWVAEQLARTPMTLSEISIAAGFSDQSHLTREFRRRFGMSPGAWRRRG
jgi:AraC family transcriptional regulator